MRAVPAAPLGKQEEGALRGYAVIREAVVLVLAGCMGVAQTGGAPFEFDAVSVRPSAPPVGEYTWTTMEGGPGTRDPGRIQYRYITLTNVVSQAFSVDARQVSGPKWLDTVRVDISATIPKGATKAQLALMVRNMLTDRFGLKVHYEKVEAAGYSLTVDKHGSKLRESVATAEPVDGAPPDEPQTSVPVKLDADGFPDRPLGRGLNLTYANGARRVRSLGGSMAQLATLVSNALNRPVTDSTGLSGKYDFTLTCNTGAGGDTRESVFPSIFSALPAQLGLKLVPKKMAVDQVVIDYMEKTPTEN
jgi:uncharacterized protein (TIGR03435 family)